MKDIVWSGLGPMPAGKVRYEADMTTWMNMMGVRMDDLELRDDIQDEVKKRWEEINTDNVSELADVDGYWEDFYRMFGFKEEGIDYEAETDPVVEIPSIKE